ALTRPSCPDRQGSRCSSTASLADASRVVATSRRDRLNGLKRACDAVGGRDGANAIDGPPYRAPLTAGVFEEVPDGVAACPAGRPYPGDRNPGSGCWVGPACRRDDRHGRRGEG